MSGNIDLNSEVVLAEPDAEPVSEVGNETLEESKKSESRIDGKYELFEEKLESGEKKNEGFDLEKGIASLDTENDSKDGKHKDVEMNLRVQDEEKMEGNDKIGVVGPSKLVPGDAGGIDDVGSVNSLRGDVDMEVKAEETSEPVSKTGRENEDMDIDVENRHSERQALGSDEDDAGESEDSDACSGSDMESEEDVKVVKKKKKVKADVAKPEFNVSDLVWGKVTSHPWWPGQIFDPSDATKKAKKYFKKDKYLIGYFGDQTFAWNDASKIKPFRQYFSQMVEQSKLEDFHDAVDCALDEVSRRVEFGLGCSCMPDYNVIKTQIIVNAGMREECCRRDGGDKFSTADLFEPLKLIEYVKALAELPSDGVDRLEFTTAQSQLLAFNRWKGYLDLPQFQNLGVSLENDAAEIKPSSKVKHGSSGIEEKASLEVENDGQKSTGEGKPKGPGDLPRKQKKIHEDMEGVPNKKEKSLADLLVERRSSSQHGKNKLDSKAIAKSISSTSGKKRKAVSPISDVKEAKYGRSSLVPDEEVVKHKSTPISDDKVAKHDKSPSSEVHGNSSQPKRTFRVGDSILRVASQLSGSSGILKSVNGSSQKAATKRTSSGKSRSKKLFLVEDSIPDEMILQLCLVAKAPLKSCDSLEYIVGFFCKFRDFICPNSVDLHEGEQSSLEHGSIEKETRKPETETSRSEQAEDSSGDEAMADSVSEEQSLPGKKKESENSVPQTPIKDETSKNETQPAIPLDPDQNSVQQTVEAANSNNDDDDDDTKPTALILNFTNLDSVPSVTNLNKIFSRYGLLMESQTEVLKKSKRAKVVFHKSTDAEAAFSSAGKYSIFGPALVSYRLKYMPSKSSKSQNAKKQGKPESPAAEGNTT